VVRRGVGGGRWFVWGSCCVLGGRRGGRRGHRDGRRREATGGDGRRRAGGAVRGVAQFRACGVQSHGSGGCHCLQWCQPCKAVIRRPGKVMSGKVMRHLVRLAGGRLERCWVWVAFRTRCSRTVVRQACACVALAWLALRLALKVVMFSGKHRLGGRAADPQRDSRWWRSSLRWRSLPYWQD